MTLSRSSKTTNGKRIGGNMAKNLSTKDKPVTIKLGDKDYVLSPLNLNILGYIEEEFECKLEQVGDLIAPGNAKQFVNLKTLLHMFLRDDYADLSKQELGKSIPFKQISVVITAITDAMTSGLPQDVIDEATKE